MRILHIVPESYFQPRDRFLGSTKDIHGRTEYFEARGLEHDKLVIPNRDDDQLRALLAATDLSGFDAALLEYTYYPESLALLRRQPKLRVLCRGINAEAWHAWDHAKVCWRHGDWKQAGRHLLAGWRRRRGDRRCAAAADHVLCITAWEKEHYWRRFAPPERLLTVPYFLPDSYRETIPSSPHQARKDMCVCLMSNRLAMPFARDAARAFSQVVERLGDRCPGWEFVLTGAGSPDWRLPGRLRALGSLDHPFSLLARARAVAHLSDLGYGFKTKLLDAICCGCWVLVTRKLFERLPGEVAPFCRVVAPLTADAFQEALQRCLEPVPALDANAILRNAAFAALDRALGLSDHGIETFQLQAASSSALGSEPSDR